MNAESQGSQERALGGGGRKQGQENYQDSECGLGLWEARWGVIPAMQGRRGWTGRRRGVTQAPQGHVPAASDQQDGEGGLGGGAA